MSAPPILYSFRRCPYAMRARMALLVSKTQCEIREVKLSSKPAEMLEASPKGTVPVMVLSTGAVLDESLDIMRWALRQNDPENWLARQDTELIEACDGPFKHHLDRYKYSHRYEDCDPLVHRASGLDFLRQLEDRLLAQTFLFGNTRGLADAAIMPFVRQFAVADRTWFADQTIPRVKGWLERLMDAALFARIMPKLAPWVRGDEPIVFPGG